MPWRVDLEPTGFAFPIDKSITQCKSIGSSPVIKGLLPTHENPQDIPVGAPPFMDDLVIPLSDK